ncbi:MAG: phage head closure protein [Alphaproteobacteria bacterium]
MIGEANARVTLEAKTLTPDGGGGYAETWESYATVWGALAPQSGREPVEAARPEMRVTHRLTIRRRSDVSANHRARQGTRTFAIVAVLDAGSRAPWMTLLCEEGAPS